VTFTFTLPFTKADLPENHPQLNVYRPNYFMRGTPKPSGYIMRINTAALKDPAAVN
jgi:hypothetical protein